MSLTVSYKKAKAFLDYTLQRTRLSGPPLFFLIDIMNACNLKCAMCPQAFPRPGLKRGMMTLETFDLVLSQLQAMQPLISVNLYLSGEPLVHPKFPELVRRTNSLLERMQRFCLGLSRVDLA